jgi:hypothetical protein
MTSHGDYSPSARAAAVAKARAATIFAEQAERIAAAAELVAEGFVLVAVVSADHELTGTHHVEQAAVVDLVPQLEGEGGWAMVFSPGTSAGDVQRRAAEMATIASARAEMIARIAARRGTADPA